MNGLTRGAGIAYLSVLALAAIGVAPAHADNFGSTPCAGDPRNCVNLGDNATHTWYPQGTLGNDIAGMAASFQTAMDDYEFFTVVVTTKAQNATTDVTVTDYSYPIYDDWLGWVDCYPSSATSGTDPNRRCDRQVLRFNAATSSNIWNTAAKRRSMSCHEIGHTLGLRHTDAINTCMEFGFNPNDFTQTTSGHDDSHINNYYG